MKLRLRNRGDGFHYRYVVIADDGPGGYAATTELWRTVAVFCKERFGEPGGAEGLYILLDIHMILFKFEPDALIFCMEFMGDD